MTTYTARLMQDSGVSGPQKTIEADSLEDAARGARIWSLAQSGHPWDTLTITNEETGQGYELQISSHGAGGYSIQVFRQSRELVADINVL